MKYKLQKGIATMLAGVTIVSFGGCKKTDNEEQVLPSIIVTDELSKSKDGVRYEYVLNIGECADENLRKTTDRPIRFMKVTDEQVSSTNLNEVSWDLCFPKWNDPNYLMHHYFFGVWPECYSHYTETDFKFNNSSITHSEKIIEDFYGSACTLRTITIKITKDMPTTLYGENVKDLKAGDVITATMLIANDSILAFNQTGAGSECQNVQSAICGEGTLKTVNEAGVLTDTNTVNMSKKEIFDLEAALNNEYLNDLSRTLN